MCVCVCDYATLNTVAGDISGLQCIREGQGRADPLAQPHGHPNTHTCIQVKHKHLCKDTSSCQPVYGKACITRRIVYLADQFAIVFKYFKVVYLFLHTLCVFLVRSKT